MPQTGFTDVTWFHATNTLTLVEDALAHMLSALRHCTAEENEQDDQADVITVGIEMDIRALYRPSKNSGEAGVWLAVLQHDPFSETDRDEVRDAAEVPSRFFTLEQCFDALVRSDWYKQQQARHDQPPKLGDASRRLFRLIVKLDFKDPRAAEVFHRHTCVEAAMTSDGPWRSYHQLCALLAPVEELSVWWNADVVPSALVLADPAEQRWCAKWHEGSASRTETSSVFDFSLDAYPSLRFIDISETLLIDLIRRTVTQNVYTQGQSRGIGLSLGWVLKLPTTDTNSERATREQHQQHAQVDIYRRNAPYREPDTTRMAHFISQLWTVLTSTPAQTSAAAVEPSLITYAVLWEAVFTPAVLLRRLCPDATAITERESLAEAAAKEEDVQACGALTSLMRHTHTLLDSTASTTRCDSPRGFLTFWKVRGEETRDDARARGYFYWCTIDG